MAVVAVVVVPVALFVFLLELIVRYVRQARQVELVAHVRRTVDVDDAKVVHRRGVVSLLHVFGKLRRRALRIRLARLR